MKPKKIIITIVICVLVLLIAGSGGYILFKNLNNADSDREYKELQSNASSPTAATQIVTDEQGSEVVLDPNPVDFGALKEQNPDIYSWIKIPDTNIDYPVLQSATNDNFYLDHGVDGQYRFAGALYTQFCNKTDYSDRVTVIYGHNMADGSMFANLHYFADPDFFSSHSEMTVYTADKELVYEIVSAFVFGDEHIMNSYNFSDDKVYRDFLDNVQSPRAVTYNVRDGIELSTDDKILILSTCLDYGEGRWLTVGRLKSEKPLAPSV